MVERQRRVRCRALARDAHVAVELDVVAVGAHLAAVGLQVPDLGIAAGAASRRTPRLRAGVIVHLELFELDDVGSICWRMTFALSR